MINEYRDVCFCETAGIGPHWPREECPDTKAEAPVDHDPVNSPSHYRWLPGIEVIDITERFNFNMGNVLKYALRADHKGRPLEDLKKAAWYLNREIERREQQAAGSERDGAAS